MADSTGRGQLKMQKWRLIRDGMSLRPPPKSMINEMQVKRDEGLSTWMSHGSHKLHVDNCDELSRFFQTVESTHVHGLANNFIGDLKNLLL